MPETHTPCPHCICPPWFDRAPIGYLRLDAQGKILALNVMAAELLAYPTEDPTITALPPIEKAQWFIDFFLAGESRGVFAAHLRQVFARPTLERCTCTVRLLRQHRTYEQLLVRIHSVLMTDATGQPICLSSLMDMTELLSAQQDRRDSERRFQELFAHLGEGVLVIATNGYRQSLVVRDVNSAASRLTSRCKEEVIGESLYAAFPGFRLVGLADVIHRVARNGAAEEIAECLYQDNRTSHWGEYRVCPLSSNEVVVIIRDVSQRRQSVEALRTSEAKFRHLFLNAVEGIFQCTREGRYINLNPAFARMLGFDAPKHALRALNDGSHLLYADPEDRLRFQNVLEREGFVKEFKLPLRRRDSTLMWTSINAKIIHAPDGRIAFYEGAIEDITERIRMEEERLAMEVRLRQQQKLEALGTLAGGVAHEINNPINGILNYAQLILDTLEPPHTATTYASEIIRETERITVIVRHLLQFARQESQVHHPADVRAMVEGTLSLIRTIMRHDQITLHVQIAEEMPPLPCRSQQIQQVLMNLLTNARDALNERYPNAHPDKVIAIIAEPIDADWMRFTVSDYGAGIPDDIKDRLFDPFFTTKPRDKGTGLGLSISHGIVKDHHGTLRFETDPQGMTRFYVDLPLKTPYDK